MIFNLMKMEFQKISIDEFVEQTIKNNPDFKADELKRYLEEFKNEKFKESCVIVETQYGLLAQR